MDRIGCYNSYDEVVRFAVILFTTEGKVDFENRALQRYICNSSCNCNICYNFSPDCDPCSRDLFPFNPSDFCRFCSYKIGAGFSYSEKYCSALWQKKPVALVSAVTAYLSFLCFCSCSIFSYHETDNSFLVAHFREEFDPHKTNFLFLEFIAKFRNSLFERVGFSFFPEI